MHFINSNTKSLYMQVLEFMLFIFWRGVGGIVENMNFI